MKTDNGKIRLGQQFENPEILAVSIVKIFEIWVYCGPIREVEGKPLQRRQLGTGKVSTIAITVTHAKRRALRHGSGYIYRAMRKTESRRLFVDPLRGARSLFRRGESSSRTRRYRKYQCITCKIVFLTFLEYLCHSGLF